MKISSHLVSRSFAVSILLFFAAFVHAATVTGTVTNKTTNKPSAGDSVVLVDVQAGMADAATATTDSKGQYSLTLPAGATGGAFLIRVTHQGASYFIAAPQSGTGGDVTVYDVAAKVDGVAIDADMILFEGSSGSLRAQERYLVRNTSNPPKAQFSDKTFEIVIPPDALLDGASATRPGGLGTNTRLTPLPEKGHYTFSIPIQPDKGQNETLFEVQYHFPYNGKMTVKPQLMMPADNFVVYVPKSMTFSNGTGAEFQNVQDDPKVITNIAKNIRPGQAISFQVSGEGQMPRDQQKPAMSPQAAMGMGGGAPATASDTSTPGNGPGGGIGNPIGTPDPLTKYKWWILGGLTLLLVVAAIYLLRGRAPAADGGSLLATVPSDLEGRPLPAVPRSIAPVTEYTPPPPRAPAPVYSPAAHAAPVDSKAALMSSIKDELFAIESDKLSGAITPEEYADAKAGLEAMLKRALKKT